jgi:hypothetical protein
LPALYPGVSKVSPMRWFALALLGILVAAAVAVVASRLVSQQIGLASEPISAGDALAPATTERPSKKPSARSPKHHSAKHPQVPTPGAPSPETYEPAPEYTEPAPAPTPSESRPSGGSHDGGGGEGPDD